MTVDAPTAGTLLMVLNHDSAFKSWHWPPKCKAHCRHNDDFTYHFTYFATIWRLRLQIVAKYVISYVKSSLCLQCALNLGGQCHDLKTLSWFNTISSVPAVGASTVMIKRLCRDLRPPTVLISPPFWELHSRRQGGSRRSITKQYTKSKSVSLDMCGCLCLWSVRIHGLWYVWILDLRYV